MKFDIINYSIVIVGREYAPNKINHDYLKSAKIVKKDWEQAEVPVYTPSYSIVKYTNGIVFATERNKLQIVDNKPPLEETEFRISELAEKLVQKIDSVQHSALGVNIAVISERSDSDNFLINKFLKPGKWVDNGLESASVNLAYSFKEAKLRVNCDTGIDLTQQPQRQGVLVAANYNFDISGAPSLEAGQKKVLRAVKDFKSYHEHFLALINDIFSEGS